jgi:hypothetical protein
MAITAGTYTTYTAIGNREDLIDVITNIDQLGRYKTGLIRRIPYMGNAEPAGEITEGSPGVCGGQG